MVDDAAGTGTATVEVEAPAHAANGVGISLSGGGLRAASFALGALQALDERLQLLRGEGAADYVAAVSGGSYIASTLALVNAEDRAALCDEQLLDADRIGTDDPRPLSQGSPEVSHILRHSRYLIEDGGWITGVRIALTVALNIITVLLVVSLVAYMTTGAALLSGLLRGLYWWEWVEWESRLQLPFSNPIPLDRAPDGLASIALALTFVVSIFLIAPVARIASAPVRVTVVIILLVVAFATLVDAVTVVINIEPLGSPQWFADNFRVILLTLAVILAVSAALVLLGAIRVLAPLRAAGRTVLGALARAIPWAVVVLTFTWSLSAFSALLDPGGWFVSPMNDEVTQAIDVAGPWLYVAPIALPYLALVIARIAPSAHDLYRTLVARCFVVIRANGSPVSPSMKHVDIALSSLGSSGEVKTPELLVCAAANVSDRGAALAGANALPLIMSSSGLSIPTIADAEIAAAAVERTGDTEEGGWASKVVRVFNVLVRRPIPIGLSSAVAITGAAVSPSMGRQTMPELRPLLAALGIRLGRWVPNPAAPAVREMAGTDRVLVSAPNFMDPLIEFVGAHSSKSPTIYASDGGHFENMGLVELLRKNCSTIWLVDASPNKAGHPLSLTQALILAEAETGCQFEIDMSALDRKDADGFFHSVTVTGRAIYADGSSAVLHIVRLGITARHSSIVKNYQRIDSGFPFHPTIQQIYTADRFEAYRRLGWESTRQLLAVVVESKTGAAHDDR